MIFDNLTGKAMPELELFEKVCHELQRNYSKYQNVWFFLRLKKKEGGSQIDWIKCFKDGHEARKFYYDSPTWRACILVKYEEDCYQPLLFGYQHSSGYVDVWPDRIEATEPHKGDPNLDSRKLDDLGKMFGGFKEIENQLRYKRKISV